MHRINRIFLIKNQIETNLSFLPHSSDQATVSDRSARRVRGAEEYGRVSLSSAKSAKGASAGAQLAGGAGQPQLLGTVAFVRPIWQLLGARLTP